MSNVMTMNAKVRQAVRVLLLDESDHVLLFRAVNPDTGVQFWFPPGGGIEADEEPHETLRREVREETGLQEFSIQAEVWHRRHVFDWRGERWDQQERWFLARVKRFGPELSGLNENETMDIKQWRWWSVEEIAATEVDVTFVPLTLATDLAMLIEHGPTATPRNVGV